MIWNENLKLNGKTGVELIVLEQSELVVKAIGFEGEEEFDVSKPDETMRMLIYKNPINITF